MDGQEPQASEIQKFVARSQAATLAELLGDIVRDPSLKVDDKNVLMKRVSRAMPPLGTDRWLYRIAITSLGVIAVATVFLGFYLAILRNNGAADLPDGLIALGSASIGALAGLIAPSPRS